MLDCMVILGAAASAKLAGDRLVRDIVSYIHVTTAMSRPLPAPKKVRSRRRKTRLSRPMKSSTSALGRRPFSHRQSKKISMMSDAELEAELNKRRKTRATERQAYSRAMRTDKLAALEAELLNLRREIGRIDTSAPDNLSAHERSSRSSTLRRQSPLLKAPSHQHVNPQRRGALSSDRYTTLTTSQPQDTVMPTSPPVPGSGGPPPPPPPPPLPMGQPGEGAITIDPEKQKREKAERQRRREEKRKEREKAKKKVTLADIIRSAGPDPAKKLKPASKKVADVEKEERERAEKDREERESKEEEQRREQEKRAIAGTKRALVGRGELCLSTTGDEIPGSSLAKKELTTREGGNMPDQERESKSLKTNDPPQQCETHGSKRDVESELPASDGILQEAKCTECKCTAERTSNSAASISETGDPGSENSKVAEEQCRININANPDFSSIVKETVERSPSTETKMVKTSPLSMNRHGKEKQIKPILVVREAGSSSISNVEETKARVSKSRLPASSAEESENISPNSGSMQAAAPINID